MSSGETFWMGIEFLYTLPSIKIAHTIQVIDCCSVNQPSAIENKLMLHKSLLKSNNVLYVHCSSNVDCTHKT